MGYSYDRTSAVIPMHRHPGGRVRIRDREYVITKRGPKPAARSVYLWVYESDRNMLYVWDHESGELEYQKRVKDLPRNAIPLTNIVTKREVAVIVDDMGRLRHLLEQHEAEVP